MGNTNSAPTSIDGTDVCQLKKPTIQQQVTICPVFTYLTPSGLRVLLVDHCIVPFEIKLTTETLKFLDPKDSPSVCRALVYLLGVSKTMETAKKTRLYAELQRTISTGDSYQDVGAYSQNPANPHKLFDEHSTEPFQLLNIYVNDENDYNISYTVAFLARPGVDLRKAIQMIYFTLADKQGPKQALTVYAAEKEKIMRYFSFPEGKADEPEEKKEIGEVTLENIKDIYGSTAQQIKILNLLKKTAADQAAQAAAQAAPQSPVQIKLKDVKYVKAEESGYRRFVNGVFNTPEKVKNFLLYGSVDPENARPGVAKAIKAAAVLGAVGGLGALAYNKRDDLSSLWTKAKGKVCTPADLTAIIQKLESVAEELDGELKESVREVIDQLKGIQTKKEETSTDFEQSEDVQSSVM